MSQEPNQDGKDQPAPGWVDRAARVWLVTSVFVGLLVRVRFALGDDGLYWPDEIHQSLEPAHRLVFGYGVTTWEFEQGARSWLLPGVLAALLRLMQLLGVDDPAIYVRVLKVLFAVWGSAGCLAVYAVARGYGASRAAAAAGAGLWSLLAPAIYFAPRMLGENASTLPLLLGWAVLAREDGRHRRWGEALLALAVFPRLQNAVFCVGWLAILAARRDGRALARAAAVFAVAALLYGLLDRWTWGGWFQSVVVYLRANVVEDVSAAWGTRDGWHYLRVLGRCMVGGLAVMVWTVPLAWATRARGLLWCTLAFLVVHSAIPHKELRFILPALPLLCVLCVVGLEGWERRMPGLRNAMAAGLVVVALLSLAQHGRLTRFEIGLEDHVNDGKTAYDLGGPINRMLMAAYREPDLCGVMITEVYLMGTGGYSHLHRDVWLLEARPETFENAPFSHIIIRREKLGDVPVEIRAQDGDWVLARVLEQRCSPRPPSGSGG